ncbi:MAG TPA: LPS export ABC transporter periplasmic protein LptC [Gammaproteobacteria bacterium]
MNLNFRNVVIFSALSAAAGASWYLGRIGTAEDQQDELRDSLPLGYYLRDAEIMGTDENGRLLYKIWAAHAEERPNENRLLLSDVRVEYRPEEDVPWTLTADFGEAPADETFVDLRGAVKLANEPEEGDRTIIQTQALRFEPGELVASSDESVSLFVGSRQLDAIGIRVFLRDERLELESSVHGEFSP